MRFKLKKGKIELKYLIILFIILNILYKKLNFFIYKNFLTQIPFSGVYINNKIIYREK